VPRARADVLIDVADAVEVVVLVDLQLFFAQRPGWTLHGRLRREIIRAVAARQVEVPVLS